MIWHVPAAVMWTVSASAIEQSPAAANETSRLELALAVRSKSGSPNVLSPSELKVIVWSALAMLNVRITSDAGLKSSLPAWLAVIWHEPAPVIWTDTPVTEQSPDAANETSRPELALALRSKSGSPNVLSPSALKVIVWSALAMLKSRTTSVAAFQLASPLWEAVISHEPAPVRWTLAGLVAASSEHWPV